MEGNRNTKFFHNVVQKRRQKLHFYILRNEEGNWITESEEIKNNAIQSFKSHLNGSHTSEGDTLLDDIPQIVTTTQSEALSTFPTIEEIHDAISNMNSNCAQGPYGFIGNFYSSCWDIIKYDLSEAISDFFAGGVLPRSWTSIYLIPAPRVEIPSSFKQL